ncbi:family 31 putative glycoside hydrolase [Podospora australis]|uniref:alpha-glucosidase n=1 Tax=Podospora australis TaxID=1536484 RepID=A0AAN7APW0_9PEZI|nr:family 31 putative glycoside hydrolase [Podospora australis]
MMVSSPQLDKVTVVSMIDNVCRTRRSSGDDSKKSVTVKTPLVSTRSPSASRTTAPSALFPAVLALISLTLAFGTSCVTGHQETLEHSNTPPDVSSESSRVGLALRRIRTSFPPVGLGLDVLDRQEAYFKQGILLFLLIVLSIGFKLYGRRFINSRQGFVTRVGLFLSIMALFTSLSLVLFTSFFPSGSSKALDQQYDPVVTTWRPAETVGPEAPIFTVPASADIGKNVLPNVKDPLATNPQVVCPGYKASNVRNTANGFFADLDLAGTPCNVYGNDVEHLSLAVEFQADNRVHVEIEPRYISKENETWFQLPEALVPRPGSDPTCSDKSSHLIVSWSNDPTFSFTVKRKDTDDTLFSTQGKVLVYEDQFIEFVSTLPENYNLYGLGEIIHGFRLGNNGTRTLFAADVGNNIDYNIYGTHPIYLDTRYFTTDESGKLTYAPDATDTTVKYQSYTHGVFLRNAHAHEVVLQPSDITWRTLGGSIDLYFYSGPKAEDVTTAYQKSTVGLPAMQQYWALGFHQCRWGYNNWTQLQEVVDSFAKFEIPLETIWLDIDYMQKYRDFTHDPVRFSYSEGEQFLAKLHASKQHYIPIVDSAIYAPNHEDPTDAYPPYERGLAADAFVKNPDGSIYYGAVWPGYTVFPDWIGSVLGEAETIDWWIDEIVAWSKLVAFDGIWIDMSEVASFCVGSCGTGNLTQNPAHPPFELPGEPGNLVLKYPEGFELTNTTEAASASAALYTQSYPAGTATSTTSEEYYRTKPTPGSRNINWPPYAINNYHGDLGVHAVSPNATHNGGYLEYDFHNLFGHQILNATYQALLKVFDGKRPFIIGRSTFAGSGKWAGHWGGDNESLWAFLFFSIPQALSFSIFGIPMFGVDTCGFAGNSNYELCSRWMQLSAFFPFYRNHNVLGAISQEPYVWSSVIDATKTAMNIRYSILPYMYTLMQQASLTGSTVMRALAWEFPNEPWLANADRQFLLGGGLMVTPCLVQGADTVNGVFPGVGDGNTVWYDWYTHKEVVGVTAGQNVTIEAPLGHIPVYLRGGYVIPTQEPAMTTADSRNNPWGLLVALDKSGAAQGKLYLDDGESLEPTAVTWVEFTATPTCLKATSSGNYTDTNPLRNATVLGLSQSPSKVSLNGAPLDSAHWNYDSDNAVLNLHDLSDKFSNGAWAASWEISWE